MNCPSLQNRVPPFSGCSPFMQMAFSQFQPTALLNTLLYGPATPQPVFSVPVQMLHLIFTLCLKASN